MPADPTNQSLTNPHYPRHQPFFHAIKSFAEACEGSVLDIGCEHKPYRDWFDVDRYIGFDISQGGSPDVLADAHHIPLQNNTVDHIFTTQVLEHCYNPFDVFTEIGRVLRPGGTLFLTTNQWYPLHEKPHDYFRFTRYSLRQLAKGAGLEPTNIFEIGSFSSRTGIRLNKILASVLPGQLSTPPIIITNVICERLRDYSFREDYSIVGLEAEYRPE